MSQTFDNALVGFLKWSLPRLGYRYQGFRKVRRQVGKRLRQRTVALDLGEGQAGLCAYRTYLQGVADDHQEWDRLRHLCRVTISRFYRDPPVFDLVRDRVLPVVLSSARRKDRSVRFWSAGCASGEEAWTIALIAHICFPTVEVEILGTDVDETVLDRAREGRFAETSLSDLPEGWRSLGFAPTNGEWEVRDELRSGVEFTLHNLIEPPPPGEFDVVFCRNLAFTYFGEALQRTVCGHLQQALRPGGALVVGNSEALPQPHPGFEDWFATWGIYRRKRGA